MKNELVVIKFGGEIVEKFQQLSNLVHSVKMLKEQGAKIVLVHGGGPYASKLSKQMGLEPKMVGGRRVTDEATLEVMKMTLPGVINSNVLAQLKKDNLPGVSVSGISFINCHKRPPKVVSGSGGKKVDFGYVGDVDGIDPTLINDLLEKNYIPVVTPLSATKDGIMMNINADTIAVKIASGIKATKIMLVTAIGGVFADIDDQSSKFAKLSVDDARDKIKEGIIQGGMIPKLEEGFALLQGQLESFHIVGVDAPETILQEAITPGSQGTAVTN